MKKRIMWSVRRFGLSVFITLGLWGMSDAAPETKIAAKVGQHQITAGEVDSAIKGQLFDLEMQIYELKQSVIQEIIATHLLRDEAERRIMTVDQLLEAEVKSKLLPVKEEETKNFFEQNRARIRGEYAQVKDQIIKYLENQRYQQARVTYLDQLKKTTTVQILLERPEEPRYEIAMVDDAYIRGEKGKDSPILIIEFSDFQCPFCGQVQPTLKEIFKHYSDQVSLVYRHFPLSIHPQAPKAGEASECAGDQGKFWEFHDYLFAHQNALEVPQLKAHAKAVGLDSLAFDQCLDSGKYASKLARDLVEGQRVGVSGTPAFYINGRKLIGSQPLERFKEIIDQELNQARATLTR
ncbi:MAG: thioredoxin domain-containing protein [Candidatus Tectomicrobia bacterium]|nr:thioredoxin domain-containing protein [Candidatus Tectomicrobia bacterium]